MRTFEFKLIIAEADVAVDGADKLYARCPDATLVTSDGRTYLEFSRSATTLEAAISSAVRDVQQADCAIDHIELKPTHLAVA